MEILLGINLLQHKTDINIYLKVPVSKEFVDVIINNNKNDLFYRISDDIDQSGFIKVIGNIIRWKLKGSRHQEIFNKLELFLKQDSEMKLQGELEIRKESEEFLKNRYDFSMENGYLTIFRCTFNLLKTNILDEFLESDLIQEPDDEKIKIAERLNRFHPFFLRLLKINSSNLSLILMKSELLTKFLWNIYKDTGPNNLIDYQNLSVYQKLKTIEELGGTVQCSGTRDLFIELICMFQSSITIRKVDAFRYYPPIDNIVVNGHSLLEFKCGTKWFLFDPYVRVYFKDSKGDLLSADDIRNLKQTENLRQIYPIHIETNHPIRKDFEHEELPYDSYGYNYFSHFVHLIYTNIKVRH